MRQFSIARDQMASPSSSSYEHLLFLIPALPWLSLHNCISFFLTFFGIFYFQGNKSRLEAATLIFTWERKWVRNKERPATTCFLFFSSTLLCYDNVNLVSYKKVLRNCVDGRAMRGREKKRHKRKNLRIDFKFCLSFLSWEKSYQLQRFSPLIFFCIVLF